MEARRTTEGEETEGRKETKKCARRRKMTEREKDEEVDEEKGEEG